MAYTWSITGPEDRELSSASARRLDFYVDAPATARFTLSGFAEEAAAIKEFETDLLVYRGQDLVFRGRILTEQDALSETGHTVTFTAKDYRGLLEYRKVGPSGLTWASVDQAQIAQDLVSHTQAKSGGALGITNGVGTTSLTLRDRTISPGTSISAALTSLGRLLNGFEWEISPDLKLNLWYPRRGVDNGVQLDYGGLCSSVNRTLVPDFANVAQVQGSNETVPVEVATADVGTDTRGRWETFRGYPTISEQSTLDDRADWVLGESAISKPGYAATVTSGRWEGRSHIWLGDTIGLRVNSGRLSVNTPQRVVTIGLDISDSDTETVYLGLIDSGTYS